MEYIKVDVGNMINIFGNFYDFQNWEMIDR